MWVVNKLTSDLANLTVMRCDSGGDSRGDMGVAVMRSLVDAAAANTLTKYEQTVRTIHENLETQQTRSDTIKAVEFALGEVKGGPHFLETQWARVLQLLEDDHPLNPRISDARNAIEHLGGMQLHLTSRKRRRIKIDDGGFDDDGRDPARDHDIAMMHLHGAEHYNERFGDFVKNTANCLLQRVNAKEHCVAKATNDVIWVECDPSDLGMAPCKTVNGEKMFFSRVDPPALFAFERKEGKGTSPAGPAVYIGNALTTPKLTVLEDSRMSACMVDLVIPACLATQRMSGVRHKSVDRVQKMMTHARGFDASDKDASAFAEDARTKAMSGTEGVWDVMFLFPAEDQHEPPDFTIDFDLADGWAIGFSPSEQTDAAESAQAYLSRLLLAEEASKGGITATGSDKGTQTPGRR
jgi:hypothetical protein